MDLDTLTSQLTDRLDQVESTIRDRVPLDRFTAPDPIVRTTWPRRLGYLVAGAALGAAAAYLADPDRGRARRNDLRDRATSTGNDLMDQAAKRADYAAGEAKGMAANAANAVTPQDVPGDPKTLEAKVRSEVFGQRHDTDKVVLRVDGPGQVAVKGTVPTPVAERELLAEIADVEGVTDVHSELSVAAG